ncbi:MAG: hypothetical protein LWW77_06755 [Propionibacteriales bacterium]|nr:hypothetical protein [Propionibacteriales bacterium]
MSVEFVNDEPLEAYALGSRIDLRATVVCLEAGSCGTVTLVMDLDPTVTYDSHSVITADRSGPTTSAEIAVLTSPRQVSFTIGNTEHPFAGGDTVTFPVSVRVAEVVEDPQLGFTATATGTGAPVVQTVTVRPPRGPGKVSASGCVWWDVDRDGFRGATEPLSAGRPVRLIRDGATVDTAVTDDTGCYVFTGLETSTSYRVRVAPPDKAGFTRGATPGLGSVVDADGVADFRTPPSGHNAATVEAADRTGLDAGLAAVNLSLQRKAPATSVQPGDEASLELLISNSGKTAALPGWRVAVVLPAGLHLVSLGGSGFTCDERSCLAQDGLPVGATASVTVVVRVDPKATAGAVVAYVRPADDEVAEAVPLGSVPSATTKTESTLTDNDVRWVFGNGGDTLADTGAGDLLKKGTLGALSLVAGGGLLLVTRRRVAD